MSIDNENFDDPDDRPLHSPARVLGMRIVVSLAIAGLVLPGILITWSTQARTAAYACEIAVAYYAPVRVPLMPVSRSWTPDSWAGIVTPKDLTATKRLSRTLELFREHHVWYR